MSFSYFLSWESPQADTFLWSTISTAFHSGAKLLAVEESEDGISMLFDTELSQSEIMEKVLSVIMPEGSYTPEPISLTSKAGQDV